MNFRTHLFLPFFCKECGGGYRWADGLAGSTKWWEWPKFSGLNYLTLQEEDDALHQRTTVPNPTGFARSSRRERERDLHACMAVGWRKWSRSYVRTLCGCGGIAIVYTYVGWCVYTHVRTSMISVDIDDIGPACLLIVGLSCWCVYVCTGAV